VEWGTECDNKVSTDLELVSVGKSPNKNEVGVEEQDVDAAYEAATLLLSTKSSKVKQKIDPTTKQEDFYKTFRTNVSHTDFDCQDCG
jgi:chitin synthase